MTQWAAADGYVVDDDTTRLDVTFVHEWLSTESYWAQGRPRSGTERALDNSLNLGLCDVFVAAPHRGGGRGIFLVRTAVGHPDVAGLRLVLGTRDAHELYRRFGFDALAAPERWMEVPRATM